MFGGSNLSLADIAAVTGNNRDGDGFGGNNGWWILIILFAIFGGWGRNGNGNGNGDGNCCNSGRSETVVVPMYGAGCALGGGGWGAYDNAALQRGFDNQSVMNKLNGIEQGICSLGYDQLAQMNNINSNISQTGFNIISNQQQGNFGLQQAIQQNSIANMQGFNQLASQQAACCCETREAIAQVRFDMERNSCETNTNIHQTGDAIINNQNQGFQMLNNTIRDGFTALSMEAKDQRIAELERKLNACDRDSALMAMGNYVVNQVRPTPVPSWDVPNPYANYSGNCGCQQSRCC